MKPFAFSHEVASFRYVDTSHAFFFTQSEENRTIVGMVVISKATKALLGSLSLDCGWDQQFGVSCLIKNGKGWCFIKMEKDAVRSALTQLSNLMFSSLKTCLISSSISLRSIRLPTLQSPNLPTHRHPVQRSETCWKSKFLFHLFPESANLLRKTQTTWLSLEIERVLCDFHLFGMKKNPQSPLAGCTHCKSKVVANYINPSHGPFAQLLGRKSRKTSETQDLAVSLQQSSQQPKNSPWHNLSDANIPTFDQKVWDSRVLP